MLQRSGSGSRKPRPSHVTDWPVADIHIGERKRPLDKSIVQCLAASIEEVGLLSSITIRFVRADVGHVQAMLVAGLHRLKAFEALGRALIPCKVLDGGELEGCLCEIAENLHRAELTVQERSDQIAEWVRLVAEKAKDGQVAHPGEAQPHERGVSKAAKELRLDRKAVRRAMKIASITPAAKEKAKNAGLENNQKALLRVAEAPSAKQIVKVQQLADAKNETAAQKSQSRKWGPDKIAASKPQPTPGTASQVNLPSSAAPIPAEQPVCGSTPAFLLRDADTRAKAEEAELQNIIRVYSALTPRIKQRFRDYVLSQSESAAADTVDILEPSKEERMTAQMANSHSPADGPHSARK